MYKVTLSSRVNYNVSYVFQLLPEPLLFAAIYIGVVLCLLTLICVLLAHVPFHLIQIDFGHAQTISTAPKNHPYTF